MSNNIGTLKQNGDGIFSGRIVTTTLDMTVALRAVGSANPRAPRFEIMALNRVAKSWVRVGALFELTSNATGEAFLNGRVDDPSMAAPLPVACFMQPDGSYNVVWSRPQRRAALKPAGDDALPPLNGEPSTTTDGDTSDPHGDGLGESTVTA